MVRITRRITESYWHDADVGGSGSTYDDARAAAALRAHVLAPENATPRGRRSGRERIADVPDPPQRSPISTGGSGGSGGGAPDLWAEALRAALLGGAAAIGYHVTSVVTRMAIRYVEEWFRSRSSTRRNSNRLVVHNDEGDAAMVVAAADDDGVDASRSASSGGSDIHGASAYLPSSHEIIDRISTALSQIALALQSTAMKLSHHIKIRLYELRRTWPLLLVAASWPRRAEIGRTGCRDCGAGVCFLRRHVFLYPLILLYVFGKRNDDGDGDGDDDSQSSEGPPLSLSPMQQPRPTTLLHRPRSRSIPTLSEVPTRTMSDVNKMNDGTTINDHRNRSDSVATQTSATGEGSSAKAPTRYLEVMIHNVSHTDLVLGVIGGSSSSRTERRRPKRGIMDLVTPASGTAGPEKESLLRSEMMERSDNEDGIDTDHQDCQLPDQLHRYVLCRPRFSAFDLFTRRILDAIRSRLVLSGQEALGDAVVSYPRYERSDATSRYNLVTPRVKNRERMLPVGFDLDKSEDVDDDGDERLTVPADEVPSLRVRGRDVAKMGPSYESAIRSNWVDVAGPQQSDGGSTIKLNGVFFPLLATLLRRWHADIADKYDSATSGGGGRRSVKKVLLLVSGVGLPRNWTHSIAGNSTQACAELMEIFVKVLYPDVTVVRIHSETNIFRYDENISFAKQELLPCVNAYRDAHARAEPYPDEVQPAAPPASEIKDRGSFDPDWKQTFSVAISFADGSPARTHAIQASLRHTYRPTYYHFWQLKTFWHDSKLSDEDIEVHPFEEMETVPAMDVAKINNEEVKLVIDEMKAFRARFLETLDENRNDIRSFWLRKSQKPVLAVLLVSDPEDRDKPRLYRGTNMEVSMPTGSLCAERNVIGTALATNPGLKREDLRMVAVLAVPLSKEDPSKAAVGRKIPSPPPDLDPNVCFVIDDTNSGAAAAAAQGHASASDSSIGVSFPEGKEFLSKVQRKLEDDQRRKQQQSSDMPRAYSSASFSSIIEEKDSSTSSKDDSSLSWTVAEVPKVVEEGSSDFSKGAVEKDATSARRPLAFHESIDFSRRASVSPPGTPMRKIKLNTSSLRPTWGGDGGSKKKRTVVVHSPEDINPLRPCGACNEWLKKIAESNPYFRVLTFTDADCNGVYVTPCQE